MLLRNKNGHCFILLFSCTEPLKKRNNHYDDYTYHFICGSELSWDMIALLKIINDTTSVGSKSENRVIKFQ